ncbi:MAG: HIT family protein [Egibacteraceae bacterium]
MSGWPSDWADLVTGTTCSMCAAGRPDSDRYGIRVQAGVYTDAYLQRAAIQRGYTVVIWRGRHVTEPTELSAEEASGYWLEALRVAKALLRHYEPLKMNYETLGNSLPHLHTHLIPRYLADPAPGRPFPLPVSDPASIPEERLRREAAALRSLIVEGL